MSEDQPARPKPDYIKWIAIAIAAILGVWFIFKTVKLPRLHDPQKEKEQQWKIEYLTKQKITDSLLVVEQARTIEELQNMIINRQDKIITNRYYYEKIIHSHDSTTASQHESYYRARYPNSQDSTQNQR